MKRRNRSGIESGKLCFDEFLGFSAKEGCADISGRFIPGAALIIFANDGLKNWISGYMNIGDSVFG